MDIQARINELEPDIAYVRSVLDVMFDAAPDEGFADDSAERTQWDEGVAFVQERDAELKRLQKLLADRSTVATAADNARSLVSGDGATFHINTRTSEDPFDLTTVDRSRNWDAEVIGRARTAIEKDDGWFNDDHRSEATRKIDILGNENGVTEQILLASSPAYRAAFIKHAKNTESPGSADDFDGEERYRMQEVDRLLQRSGFWQPVDAAEARALALTNITGKLVPAQLDPSVIISNDGSANPFRQISRVIPTATNVWTGTTSAGISGGWTGAEASEVDDDTPTFVNPTVTCYMADAFVPISFQGYEDWSGGMSEIERLIVDYKDNLEAAAFATGSGSNQPFGIVTALAQTTAYIVAMATNGTYALTDLYSVKQALPYRWKPNANFVSSEQYLDRTRQFGTSNNYHGFTVDLNSGDLAAVFGKPWHLSSSMTTALSTTTNNAIVYGDFKSGYVIADRIGLAVEFVPNLFHTGNNRPSASRGWLAHWRVGADSIIDSAFRLLFNPNTAYV